MSTLPPSVRIFAVGWLFLGLVTGCGREVPPQSAPDPTLPAAPETSGNVKNTARTPEQALRTMTDGLRTNQPQAVWYVMPRGFRDDLEGLIHEFAAQVDPTLWHRSFAVWRKVVRVLDEQRGLVLAHSEFVRMPPEARTRLRERLAGLTDLLRLIVESDLADLDKLRRLSVGEFLAKTGTRLLEQVGTLAESAGEDSLSTLLSDLEPRVLDNDGQTARVGWFLPGEKQPSSEFFMVRLDHRWMPAGWATAWEQVRGARAALKEKPNLLGDPAARKASLDQAEAVLDALLAAKSGDEFESVLREKLSPSAEQELVALLRSLAGDTSAPAVTVEIPAEDVAEPVPNFPRATAVDYVIVRVRGRVDAEVEERLFADLTAAVPGDADLLTLPDGAGLKIQVGPVADVAAFAERLRFGRVTSVDAEQRQIELEVNAQQ